MYLEGQPNLTDEFDLLYVRRVHGWSDLHVVTRDTQIAVGITHIFSDPIEELSELCCGLLRGDRCMARLPDEPGLTVVIASIYAEQRHVAQIEFWEFPDWDNTAPCGTLTLSADIKVRQFVGLLYRQFEKVRWLFEQKSYRKNRDPFPHAAFETLQQLWMKSSQ
jgi:hypothetical protein